MTTKETALTARTVVGQLRHCGISHVVWLVDSESHHLYEALHADTELKLVPVCREGEAVAVALGLMVGGQEPVVIIQNTGFYESGDSLRGLALDLKLPLLMLVSYRGFRRDGPITDSAATFLEPVLRAWGMQYHLVETDADAHLIEQAHREARALGQPVAVLMAKEYE